MMKGLKVHAYHATKGWRPDPSRRKMLARVEMTLADLLSIQELHKSFCVNVVESGWFRFVIPLAWENPPMLMVRARRNGNILKVTRIDPWHGFTYEDGGEMSAP